MKKNANDFMIDIKCACYHQYKRVVTVNVLIKYAFILILLKDKRVFGGLVNSIDQKRSENVENQMSLFEYLFNFRD